MLTLRISNAWRVIAGEPLRCANQDCQIICEPPIMAGKVRLTPCEGTPLYGVGEWTGSIPLCQNCLEKYGGTDEEIRIIVE